MIDCPIHAELAARFPLMPDPVFDQMLNDWQHEIACEEPWAMYLPADYQLPALPIRMAIEQTRRRISSSFDTQLMEVIS